MKATRIGVMVLGIVVLMFVITPYVSAQAIEGVWFKGKASLKGYEITNRVRGTIVGKSSGSGTIYVNIVDGAELDPLPPNKDADHYYVTTCIEDPDVDGVWHLGEEVDIWKGHVYGDVNTVSIWDFAVNNDPGMNFYQNIFTYPIFYVKTNGSGTKSNFSSFACILYDDSEAPARQLGSCSISFATVDSLKVPRGATGCIVTAP